MVTEHLVSPSDALKMRAAIKAGQPATAEEIDQLTRSYLLALELIADYAELERRWEETAARLSEFSERGAVLRQCATEVRAVSK